VRIVCRIAAYGIHEVGNLRTSEEVAALRTTSGPKAALIVVCTCINIDTDRFVITTSTWLTVRQRVNLWANTGRQAGVPSGCTNIQQLVADFNSFLDLLETSRVLTWQPVFLCFLCFFVFLNLGVLSYFKLLIYVMYRVCL